MTKCHNAEKFKARRPPACGKNRGGKPCDVCHAKWQIRQSLYLARGINT